MRRHITSFFTMGFVLIVSSRAAAQEISLSDAAITEIPALAVCGTDRPSRRDGPLSIGLLDGGLGMARRACPRSEVYLAAEAYLVAELADFYGNIRVSGIYGGSWAISDRTEVFAALEVIRFHTVISSVGAAELGTGYASLGFVQQLWRNQRMVLALTSRLVLPTASRLDRNSSPLALDVGATFEAALHRVINVHGALLLAGSVGLSAGPADPRGGVRLLAGLDWHPWTWLAIVLELQAGFGYRAPVDLVSASLGFRFAIGHNFGIELAALYPFAGDERALLAGALNLSWRF
jgi:hypothetical protein